MKKRSRFVVQTGPARAREWAPGSGRSVALGKHTWELLPPPEAVGEAWTWRRAGLLERTWSLASERGTHLVLHGESLLHRRWRAEAASGGWTLARGWVGGITVTDDHDAAVMRLHTGWLGRARIEPASGPDLAWRRHLLTGYTLETGEGLVLLTLARSPGFLTSDRRLTLSDAVRSREDLLPLLALTWLSALAARHAHGH
jgi:hypothetical protein